MRQLLTTRTHISRRITLAAILLALSGVASSISASPTSDFQKLGEGEMNYMFWTIYSAELFSSVSTGEQALKIEYQKSIDSQALIDATEDQWNQLGYTQKNINAWLEPLNALWPNVKPGNTLTIIVAEDQTSRFYFDDQPIGVVSDKGFGQAFLSIWLSEKTSEPKLRKQLLGLVK
ncbi:chalcone isomerase family protein [Vibrio kagoshimensis]|uniref:chalcone isomerase family protein n=1 Tax=Vibrio kagoshimensis TaxID=2910244 RepID=UPI003D1A3938